MSAVWPDQCSGGGAGRAGGGFPRFKLKTDDDSRDWAALLIDDAESLVARAPKGAGSGWRAGTLARLAEMVAIGGDHDRSEAFIGQITDPDQREEALDRFAVTLVQTP